MRIKDDRRVDIRFANGASPAPRWWDTHQTTRLSWLKKRGGSGSPRTGTGGSPLAKRIRFILRRLLRRKP